MDLKEQYERSTERYQWTVSICCVVLAFCIMFAWGYRNDKRGKTSPHPYGPTILMVSFASSVPLNQYILRCGLPTWLTFGVQVGKILPATCAESVEVEGPDGVPCNLERLSEWWQRLNDKDGSNHYQDFESTWAGSLFIIVLLVGFCLFSQCSIRRDDARREEAERDRRDEEQGMAGLPLQQDSKA